MTPRIATIVTVLGGFAVLQSTSFGGGLPESGRSHADNFRDEHFTLSEECGLCHISAPGATALKTKDDRDVSPYYTWQATMMANAFRDPYYRAQLMKETEAAGEEIQELCLRCHTPMVHHEAVMAGDPPPRLATVVEEMAADDGVSCTVCHMITAEDLGKRQTMSGRPNFNDQREIYGPYADVFPRPMQNLVGYTPTKGAHIKKSALCGSCHTLFTSHGGKEFPEQSPYLEWRNSEFSDERDEADPKKTRTCQQCHMPVVGKMRIARNPMGFDFGRIPEREEVRSHAFLGGNAFMLDILREHRDDLLVEAEDEQLEAMAAATRDQLATRTATLRIDALELASSRLRFDVAIEILTGHKFPSAYPSRRAWLHVEVLDGEQVVFASGAYDEHGRLVGIEDELRIPHVARIERSDQVAVFELIADDPDGNPTTYLGRMTTRRKDNRLLPRGYRLDGPHAGSTAPIGIGDDRDFRAGGDTVAFDVPLPAGGVDDLRVRARLLYQTVPPAWVDALRPVKAEEAQRFVGYYDQAEKKPELIAEAEQALR